VAEQLAAPFAGRLLADLGATVIKVERPRLGDASRGEGPFPADRPDREASASYAYLNRGKRSVTLDWTAASGRDVLDRLIAASDVLLVDDRAGFTYEDLTALTKQHERLTAVAITPFGLSGPHAHWRGSHAAACAHGGLTLYTGEQEREPISPPHELGSYQGGLAGAIGAVLGVLGRGGRFGRGQVTDVAVADVLSTIHTGSSATHWVFGSRSWIRHGRRSASGRYPQTILRCLDGWFRLYAVSGREWRGLLEMMGNPEWGSDPKYEDRIVAQEQYADELDARIEAWLEQYPKQRLFEMSREHGVPSSPVRDMSEVATEPQLLHREFFERALLPDGRELRVPGRPYRWDGADHRRAPLRAPRLGEDNAGVYGELGVGTAEQDELRREGVI
jgi:crotonobetainyl-CoA:carnitine CoA-transferase CaiB-like acyl-CoA transferase